MSPDPEAPVVALPFGAAYDRLQEVAAELGADATMAPDRLIALLREGKGLERALRDHLERVEQEVRAIEDGDGAVPFRIADPAASRAAPATTSAVAAPPADVPAPPAPTPTAAISPAPAPATPAPATPAVADPLADVPGPVPTPAPAPPPAPTLGFPDDDDIPF